MIPREPQIRAAMAATPTALDGAALGLSALLRSFWENISCSDV